MDVHLWDGTNPSPYQFNTHFTQGTNGYWGGLSFITTQQLTWKGLRYYWTTLNSNYGPSRLALWTGLLPSGNLERLYTLDNPSVPSSSGWADYIPGSTITLLPGRVYHVGAWYPQTVNPTYLNSQQNDQLPQSPPLNVQVLWHPQTLNNVDNNSWGDNYGASPVPLVDVILDGQPAPQPATVSDLNNALASYLNSGGANFSGTALSTIQSIVSNSNYGNAGLLSFMQGIYGQGTLQAGISIKDLTALIELVSAAVELVQKLLGGPPGREPGAIIDANGKPAIDYLIEIATTVTDSRNYLETMRGIVDYPGGVGWQLVDETDFQDDLAWTVPADLYVVSISTVPASVPDVEVAGVHWLPRLGWWAELNNQHAGERRFLDRQLSLLHDGRRRLAGLWLHCRTGTQGHVQAWQRVIG